MDLDAIIARHENTARDDDSPGSFTAGGSFWRPLADAASTDAPVTAIDEAARYLAAHSPALRAMLCGAAVVGYERRQLHRRAQGGRARAPPRRPLRSAAVRAAADGDAARAPSARARARAHARVLAHTPRTRRPPPTHRTHPFNPYLAVPPGGAQLSKVPKSMIVIGAGVIGLEMGSVWRRLGAEVTVVEFLDRITPGLDSEIAKTFQRTLTKQGMKFKMQTKVVKGERAGAGVKLTVESVKKGEQVRRGAGRAAMAGAACAGGGLRAGGLCAARGWLAGCSRAAGAERRAAARRGLRPRRASPTRVFLLASRRGRARAQEVLEADIVLVAIGRSPFTTGLGLDAQLMTNVPGIYAIGDVIRGPMLAHKAEEEGIAVIENIAGKHGHVNYETIPNVIYTHPEVACVGKTEDELKAAGVKYKVGKFPFMANSRARANANTDGLVKFVTCAESDKILGVHIIAANAGEMIAEGVLGMEYARIKK